MSEQIDLDEMTLEELESYYKGLLKERIHMTAKSRLEPDGPHAGNMAATTRDDIEEYKDIARSKRGIELSGKSYEQILQDLCAGKYHNKQALD